MKSGQISFRKPKLIVEQHCLSWSNKYWIYLGRHYHEAGKDCWVIGAQSTVTGQSTERHYNTAFGAKDPKGEALVFWHTFHEKMIQPPESEEKDEQLKEFEIAMQNALGTDARRKGYHKDPNPVV